MKLICLMAIVKKTMYIHELMYIEMKQSKPALFIGKEKISDKVRLSVLIQMSLSKIKMLQSFELFHVQIRAF